MDNENQAPKEANTQEKQDRNRKGMRIAGGILLLIVIAALIGNGKMKQSSDTVTRTGTEDCKPGDLFSQSTGKPCPQPEENAAVDDQPAVASAYEEAIRLYGGKIVVLDAQCKALPAAQTLPVDTRVLIANNSPKQLTIAVPGRTEVLDGYHYFTSRLTTAGDISVTCNGAPAATITVAANK